MTIDACVNLWRRSAMRAGDGERLQSEVASVLDWWTLAGLSVPAAEQPRDWLAPSAPPPVAAPSAPAPAALPDTLDAFLAWLAADGEAALLGPADCRLAPAGAAGAALMVLVDMPGPSDAEAGALMSDAAGRLLDRILAAIGTAREAVWLAPLVPARPAGGRVPAARLAALGRVAEHHIALVAPERVLLMGAAAAEAVLGRGLDAARGRVHDVGGRPTVATFSPGALLLAPALKAGAWADLLRFTTGRRP